MAGLACAALAVAAYALLAPLPHPREASQQQLWRWLVLRDVAAEPQDIQRALVDRLQQELIAGIDDDASGVALSEAYHRQLLQNIAALRRVWFEARVEGYANLPEAQRSAFLEQQIEVIDRWSTLQSKLVDNENNSADNNARSSAAAPFFDEIDRWIADARGERHREMVDAVRDGVVCWLATRDLSQQSAELRRDLALRIARELDAGLAAGEATGRLTAAQQQRLVENGKLLLEAWLLEQAGRYAQLAAGERLAFLDAKIDAVSNWGVAEYFARQSKTGDGAASSSAATARLLEQVDDWISRADPDSRPQLQKLVNDFRGRMVWRHLQALLPSW